MILSSLGNKQQQALLLNLLLQQGLTELLLCARQGTWTWRHDLVEIDVVSALRKTVKLVDLYYCHPIITFTGWALSLCQTRHFAVHSFILMAEAVTVMWGRWPWWSPLDRWGKERIGNLSQPVNGTDWIQSQLTSPMHPLILPWPQSQKISAK